MNAIADWTVEDLMVLLTCDLETVDVHRSANGRLVMEHTDLTPLVDQAIAAGLLMVTPDMLCITDAGWTLARNAEQDQFIASIIWRGK